MSDPITLKTLVDMAKYMKNPENIHVYSAYSDGDNPTEVEEATIEVDPNGRLMLRLDLVD